MKEMNEETLSPEKFVFMTCDFHDEEKKQIRKSVGSRKDAWRRFVRNKGSVVAAGVIVILIIFAIVIPFVSRYHVLDQDGYYKYMPAKSKVLGKFGILDGTVNMKAINQWQFDYYHAIPGCIVKLNRAYTVEDSGRSDSYYDIKIDAYQKVGFVYQLLTRIEFEQITKYQEKTGIQMLYPMIDTNQIQNPRDTADANLWYVSTAKGAAKYDENGDYTENYLKDANGNYQYYFKKNGGTQYQVRVLYSDYYQYEHGFPPCFLFGTDGYGKDILVNLAVGARLSFLLSFVIAFLNFCIGTLYGAIEGYYGGKVDLYMERFIEIIDMIPFIIIVTLFQLYFAKKAGVLLTLIFAFLFNGWTGIAGRVRSQFYRFKGKEYVLAARTLGASDGRLIFRHILPNAFGTIITGAVLLIPNVIFAETYLSFLGIINLQTSGKTSIGILLQEGQACLTTNPQVIFFPAVFLSLLMICFHLFGNGLRDAFNPALRGSKE